MFPNSIFEIGIFKPNWYGTLTAVGLVIALMIILPLYSKRLGVPQRESDFVFYDLMVAIPLGYGCAALWQATFSYIDALKRGEEAVFGYSGITVIGGLVGGAAVFIIGYLIFRKRFELDILRFLPIIAPMITVSHGFGRIGCFFVGCCHGKPADSALGMTFVNSQHINRIYWGEGGRTVPLIPTQLYEAIFLLLLFAVLSFLLLKFKFMYTMSTYLISYGIFRFVIEFFRGDDRGAFVSGISPSQTLSIFLVALGVVWLFVEIHLRKKRIK